MSSSVFYYARFLSNICFCKKINVIVNFSRSFFDYRQSEYFKKTIQFKNNYYNFINFENLIFAIKIIKHKKKPLKKKTITLYTENWAYCYKNFNIFFLKKINNLYLIEKKEISNICINFYIHKNIFKTFTCSFIFYKNTHCCQAMFLCEFFFKIIIYKKLKSCNTIQSILNKISFNDLNESGIILNYITDLFKIVKNIIEIFEKNKRDFFYFIFYNIIFYLILKKINHKKNTYIFIILYLNFEEKNHFEEKTCNKEYYLNFFLKNKYQKINLQNNFVLKKKIYISEINFSLKNFNNRLIFLPLFFTIKMVEKLVIKNQKIIKINLGNPINRISKKNKKIFLKIHKKIKKIKKYLIHVKIYFIGIMLLEQCMCILNKFKC